VILADLAVDRNCRVHGVDCFAHRRYVVSFATFHFACGVRTGTVQQITPAARATIARTHALLSGSTDLVDLEAPAGVPPTATVAMMRPEGSSVSVPAYFAVRAGETATDFLEREGDRTFYDPVSDDTITLRELYAAAEVPGETTLSGAAAALAGLEGRTLSVGRNRSSRQFLAELLQPDGLERIDRELGGRPERAAELPATLLAAVAPRSTLGRFLADMTIADVADRARDEFAAAAAETGSQRNRKNVEAQARDLWDTAARIRSIRA
jgi:hypothetical protein